VGRLSITGNAEDGSIIFASDSGAGEGLPVFTGEGLKVTLDLAPTDIPPPASRAAISAKAVKLSFNKPVDNKTAEFTWGGDVADHTFNTLDYKSVFIWTDFLDTSGKKLFWNVAAKDDPFDTANSNTGAQTFTKAPENQRLTLVSTNIYEKRPGGGAVTAGTANFPADGTAITLTFSRALTGTDYKVYAALKQGSAPANLSDPDSLTLLDAVIEAAKVTIKPVVKLDAGKNYFLMLQIIKGSESVFDAQSLAGYSGKLLVVSGSSIEFKTAVQDKLKLDSTNIYAGRKDSGPLSSGSGLIPITEANFPISGAITLTFTRDIPAGSKVKAALNKGAFTTDWVTPPSTSR
jgi:hypothetical protein